METFKAKTALGMSWNVMPETKQTTAALTSTSLSSQPTKGLKLDATRPGEAHEPILPVHPVWRKRGSH